MQPTDQPPTYNSRHVDAIEFLADLLARSEEEGRVDDFYGRLCEATVRLTSMKRAVIFRYDAASRRARPVGGYGVDLAVFADDTFTVDVAPMTRTALEEDRVIEAALDLQPLAARDYAEVLGVKEVVCAPMVARGRWIGVIMADRAGPAAAPLDASEGEMLWTLGKTAALASMARLATRQQEKALSLQQRIDMVRDIHDGVLQRLFGVSLALAGDEPFGADARGRAAREIEAALAELRSTLIRAPMPPPSASSLTLAGEIERLRHEHPEVEVLTANPPSLPDALASIAQSVLLEAVRNAKKHADAPRITIDTSRAPSAFVLEVTNDGVEEPTDHANGIGLQLAALSAVHAGGKLDSGYDGIRWRVRLELPLQTA